jgi:phosphoserine phosphatase
MRVTDLPVLEPDELIETFLSRLDPSGTFLAFDADGTLWSGDVSDDVFLSACSDQWLLESARPALIREAERAGLSGSGSTSDLALALFDSQKAGAIAEVDLFAMMAWCYAGHTLDSLISYAADVLTQKRISDRFRPEVLHVLNWARCHEIHCFVVSASPSPIVTWAAGKWGFEPDQVIGTRPLVRSGVIAPEIIEDVPFGADKCKLLKRRTGSMRWLASFGDSEFDLDMLAEAEIAVGVCPKPNLLARLSSLSHAIVLRTRP